MIEAHKFNSYMRAACADILASGTINGQLSLRPTQREAIEAYEVFLDRTDISEQEKLSGFFEIPTGIGKTALMGALALKAQHFAKEDGHSLRIGIIAPTNSLLYQTGADLEELFSELKGKIGFYNESFKQLDRFITVITYDSWGDLVDAGILNAHSFDILFSDEGHRGTSPTREKRLIKAFDGILTLAVTATAHFDEEKTVYNTHKNCIYEQHIPTALRQGELASYIQVQAHIVRVDPTSINDQTSERRAKQIAFNKDFVLPLLLSGVDERMGEPLTDNQGAIYIQDTTQADELETLLNENPTLQRIAEQKGADVFCAAIHSHLSSAEQTRREIAYRQGRILFLISDEKYKEGFNHQPLKTVIDGPHGSLVDKVQISGRGTRRFYNDVKRRFEGLTLVDAIVYVGSADPAEDEKLLKRAVAKAILATDILDGEILIEGPDAPEAKNTAGVVFDATGTESQGKQPDGTITPVNLTNFQQRNASMGAGVRSYTHLNEIKTLLADRERIRQEESSVDLSDPENRTILKNLLDAQNNPDAVRIFEAMPLEARTPDDDGFALFRGPAAIRTTINGTRKSMSVAQWNTLLAAIPLVPKIIKLADAEISKTLDDLMAQKGKPTITAIYAAIPPEAKRTIDGRPPDITKSIINNVFGHQETLRISQWEAILAALNSLPDDGPIDLTDTNNRKLLRDLWLKKGKPGHRQVQAALPQGALIPDAAGRKVFSTIDELQGVLYCARATTTRRRWNAVFAAMESLPDNPRIDLEDEDVMRRLRELMARKGNRDRRVVFNALPASAKTPDAEGNILFKSHNILNHILSGSMKSVRVDQWNVLIATLEAMPDADPNQRKIRTRTYDPATTPMIDLKKPENRKRLQALMEANGNPSRQKVFAALDSHDTTPNTDGIVEFVSPSVIHRALRGELNTWPEPKWNKLILALERMQSQRIQTNEEPLRPKPKNRDRGTKVKP